ncbi:MAG: hypothetical protein L0Z62_13325 [Gemmataceae bacterium]|nr:hypothetical protein [Gemmataceae bacterium]
MQPVNQLASPAPQQLPRPAGNQGLSGQLPELTEFVYALLCDSLSSMHPPKHEAFVSETFRALADCVAQLSTSASEYSAAGWDRIERRFRQFGRAYLARAYRLDLQNPDDPEAFCRALRWMNEQGTVKDLPALRRLRQTLAPGSEAVPLVEKAVARITGATSREPEPPGNPSGCPVAPEVESALNLFIFARLGDALLPDLAGSIAHEAGCFVCVLHAGDRQFRGVLDVVVPGGAIAWHAVTRSKPTGQRWAFEMAAAGKRPQGVLTVRQDGGMTWQSQPAPASP